MALIFEKMPKSAKMAKTCQNYQMSSKTLQNSLWFWKQWKVNGARNFSLFVQKLDKIRCGIYKHTAKYVQDTKRSNNAENWENWQSFTEKMHAWDAL